MFTGLDVGDYKCPNDGHCFSERKLDLTRAVGTSLIRDVFGTSHFFINCRVVAARTGLDYWTHEPCLSQMVG